MSLINTCIDGDLEKVKFLLKNKATVHTEYNWALQWSSGKGYTDIVRLLLENKADVHVHDDYSLRWSSRDGHTEVVKLLLESKANVHAKDEYALKMSSECGYTDVVNLLILYGADYWGVRDVTSHHLRLRKLMELPLLYERLKTHEKDTQTQLLDIKKILWMILQF